MKKTMLMIGGALLVNSTVSNAVEQASKPRRDYIEEVVVTAQKRSESIQDVPIAVSVLSADRMRNSAMESFEDVSMASPNTEINMTPGYVQVGMRGLNSPINDGMEQSVGFYVDGIYYGKTAFLQDAFLDLARVELLKGPQGTLFGKNSVAGAINVTSAKPGDEWEASLSLVGGELGNKKVEAMVNAPLIDERLSLRLAATRHERDGYVHNTLRGEDEKIVDKEGLRARLLFNATDDLSLLLTAYTGSSHDTGQGWEPYQLEAGAALVHGLFDSGLEDRFDYQSHTNAPNRSDSDTDVMNLEMNWDVGEHLVTLIASHAAADEFLYLDADTASAPIADWGRSTDYKQDMLELRLTSGPGEFEYIVGLFGFRSDNTLVGDLRMLPDQLLADVVGEALGLSGLLDALSILDPILTPIDNLLSGLTTDNLHQLYTQKTETRAVFSQFTWNITDELSVIAGLRASSETKDVVIDQDYESTGLLLQAAFGVTEYRLDDSRDESNFAPKLSIKYALGDDLLYASYAEGFKAGGYNPLARTADEAVFDQETAVAYELGYKLSALEGALTLNAAAYHTRFSDMQIQAFIGNGFIVSNAAEAVTKGVEFDLNFQPFAGTQIFASWGYTDARFEKFTDGPCMAGDSAETCDLTGARLPRAPEYSATAGFNTAIPVFDSGAAFVIGSDLNWRDDIFFDLDQDPIDSQEAYHLINLHAGIIDLDGAWQFMVHVKNLEDRTVRQFSADLPIFEGSHMGFLQPPRIITANLNLHF